MKTTTTIKYDLIGISSATICLIHCIVFPLLTFIPFGIKHIYVDTFFALIGLYVFTNILKSNTNRKVKYILTVGISFVLLSLILSIFFKIDNPFILFGGFIMIVGHALNYYKNKCNTVAFMEN